MLVLAIYVNLIVILVFIIIDVKRLLRFKYNYYISILFYEIIS